MEGGPRKRMPVSLGDRLDVVALVCSSATFIVLGTNLIAAFVSDVTRGAAPSAAHQRVILLAQPANVPLGVLVLVGATALSIRRWLSGDTPSASETLGRFVVAAAATVAVLAVVGMFAEVLWRFQGAPSAWRITSVGTHTAAAALGGLACWLALPRGWVPPEG